jgi:hypothetical protein
MNSMSFFAESLHYSSRLETIKPGLDTAPKTQGSYPLHDRSASAGVYLTLEHYLKFSPFEPNPTCPLCTLHFSFSASACTHSKAYKPPHATYSLTQRR